MLNRRLFGFAALLFCFVLAGCPSKQVVAPPPPPPEPTAEEKAAMAREAVGRRHVDLGQAHFEAGNYPEAEHMLLTPEVWQASPGQQLRALKFLAFTYCVSERPQQCRQSFERAFQLDARFDLDPAEQNHPLWGQAFNDVKSAQSR
jgi:Tfp pilus assembly protein PilF